MKPGIPRSLTLVLIATISCAIPASAQATRSSGETYVYEVAITSNTQVDTSKLPAAVRAAVEANLAASRMPTVYVVTLTTGQVNGNGSANVRVHFTDSREPKSAVFERVNQFDATLSAAGQLLPIYDPNMRPPPNQMSEDQMRNTKAQTIDEQFATFNDFAGGCGKHGRLKTGDAWESPGGSRFSLAQNGAFAVTAVAGTVAAVTMKGGYSSPATSNKFEAAGHYDMGRRLVLDLHIAHAFENTVGASGTSTVDYKLR